MTGDAMMPRASPFRIHSAHHHDDRRRYPPRSVRDPLAPRGGRDGGGLPGEGHARSRGTSRSRSCRRSSSKTKRGGCASSGRRARSRASTIRGSPRSHSFEEIPGSSSSSSRHLLVMELVEGEGLDQKIAAGPLPLEESLSLAKQIAEALEAAHEKGIVHRDLKPANVKVTHDGRVKLLDFGLAKIFEGDGGPGSAPSVTHSPTLTARATAAGVILGTAAYMSPEQARGKPRRQADGRLGVRVRALRDADGEEGLRRRDGQRHARGGPHEGAGLGGAARADAGEGQESCCEGVCSATRSSACATSATRRIDLEEEPPRRRAATGQLPFEEKTAAPSPTVASAERASRERGSKKVSLSSPWALAAAFAAAAGALALRARAPQRATVIQGQILLSSEDLMDGGGAAVVVSPDGSQLAYVTRGSRGRLYLRRLDRLVPVEVPESDGALSPFFSPDGKWIGFFARGKLRKAPVSGGAPVHDLRRAAPARRRLGLGRRDRVRAADDGRPLRGPGVRRRAPVPDEGGRRRARALAPVARGPARRQGGPLLDAALRQRLRRGNRRGRRARDGEEDRRPQGRRVPALGSVRPRPLRAEGDDLRGALRRAPARPGGAARAGPRKGHVVHGRRGALRRQRAGRRVGVGVLRVPDGRERDGLQAGRRRPEGDGSEEGGRAARLLLDAFRARRESRRRRDQRRGPERRLGLRRRPRRLLEAHVRGRQPDGRVESRRPRRRVHVRPGARTRDESRRRSRDDPRRLPEARRRVGAAASRSSRWRGPSA